MNSTTLLLAQRRIAVVWFGFAAVSFLVLIGQTMVGDVYATAQGEDLGKQVWQWWMPQVLPTLGLVLGVLANIELVPQAHREASSRRVTRFFLTLAMGLSIFYLAIVLGMLFLVPLKSSALARVGMLQGTSYFLGPLQGLTGAALGVFFVSSRTEEQP